MSVDLTCPTCKGTGEFLCPRCDETHSCPRQGCDGSRRLPTLDEWDALKDERDRYREALEEIADPRCGVFIAEDGEPGIDCGAERRIARAALDSDPDLAERTRRIRADE